jgi:transposase
MKYPLEYRKKVLEIKVKKGMNFKELSEYFEIPIRTLFRWSKRIEPIANTKSRNRKVDQKLLLKDVEENPDAYCYERGKKFGVSASTIHRNLQSLKISSKKKSKSSKGK